MQAGILSRRRLRAKCKHEHCFGDACPPNASASIVSATPACQTQAPNPLSTAFFAASSNVCAHCCGPGSRVRGPGLGAKVRSCVGGLLPPHFRKAITIQLELQEPKNANTRVCKLQIVLWVLPGLFLLMCVSILVALSLASAKYT